MMPLPSRQRQRFTFRKRIVRLSNNNEERKKGGRRKRGFLKLLNISLEIFEENREMERNFRDPREYIP